MPRLDPPANSRFLVPVLACLRDDAELASAGLIDV